MAKLASVKSYRDHKVEDPSFSIALHEEIQGLRFGATVAMLREKRGLTQADLANAMDSKQPNVARIEKGAVPGAAVMTRLAKALQGTIILRSDGSLVIEADADVRLAA